MTALNQAARRLTVELPSNGKVPDEFFNQTYIPKVKAKTHGQQEFIDTLEQSVITLCYGPSGTGKSYLTIGKAIEWLLANKVKKIVLCRPAIECGESLGFLPGDMMEKIQPYMRPLLDKIYKFLDGKQTQKFIQDGKIEIMPLAYMRGLSVDDACIILDEAQNAKYNQILMFLTRLGENSRAIVCGDTDQTDLGSHVSGAYHEFIYSSKKSPYIDGMNVVQLTDSDIVRSDIVQKIVKKFTRMKS